MFEFGSGYSSLYWARAARSVVSVENDAAWHRAIATRTPGNLDLQLVTDPERFAAALEATGRTFDVIVVDGVRRAACARAAVPRLKSDGLLILDNSDWYPKTTRWLREQDLIQVDFTGLGPFNYYTWTTSLYLQRGFRVRALREVMPRPGIGSLRHQEDPE